MQPSDPTPEEREHRDEVLLTMLDGNNTTLEYYGGEENVRKFWADRDHHRAENAEALDYLTALAYQRGVRDAMAGIVKREVVTKVCERLDVQDYDWVAAILETAAALTPPEPTE